MAVQDDKRIWWYFTFGCGQPHSGHYVRIFGTFEEARKEMFSRYGGTWAFQYSEQDWLDWERKCKSKGIEYMLETELDDGA